MKDETDLLVIIDDVLSEIAMIKRVQQDQEHVCIAMKSEQDRMEMLNKRDAGQGQGMVGGFRVPSAPGPRPSFHQSHTIPGDQSSVRHNQFGNSPSRASPSGRSGDPFFSPGLSPSSPAREYQAFQPRPVLARQVDARLLRQEEDARRIRESVSHSAPLTWSLHYWRAVANQPADHHTS